MYYDTFVVLDTIELLHKLDVLLLEREESFTKIK